MSKKWSPASKRVALAAYLCLLAFVVAHSANALMADTLYLPPDRSPSIPTGSPELAEPPDTPQQSAKVILQSGLFILPPGASTELTATAPPPPPPPPLDAAKKVSLSGTVLGKQGGVMAVLEDLASKQQSLYRLGQAVPNVGALAAIEKDRVLFREGTREEWLELVTVHTLRGRVPASVVPLAVAPPTGPHRRTLDRREIDAALADTTRLLTQAQAVPYLTDGKLDGFRLYSVMPLGFFDKIGLQTNDVLQRINGVELRDPGMLLSLFQQLRRERTIRVDLVRNTHRQTLTYDIR
ncbi:type II secretion system protein N [Nitrospira sp. NS4]|uniref:type II secretion system protein N n=1 Tax=Nitrospira sp. NS4 TaxID=3414498 RepID=UPI003C2F3F01